MTKPINVSKVVHRSPFRYPGGKTWAVPYVHAWLRSRGRRPRDFVEPFAGGASVGLSVLFEDLTQYLWLAELDSDVAAVWKCLAYGKGGKLANKILTFVPTEENARQVLSEFWVRDQDVAFACLLRNRVARGGILAPGAGLMKAGENGKGMFSRWYPDTLAQRIMDIVELDRLHFIFDGWHAARTRFATDPKAVWFIDPPYPVAGRRLYRHNDLDHDRLFHDASKLAGDVLLTYADSVFVRGLAETYQFEVVEVPMKTTHHTVKNELFIGKDMAWLRKELAEREQR